MATPHHIQAAAAGSGNKENVSENEATVLDLPVLHKEVAFSAKGRKKPAGFNLRKSIAWNSAFFTEEGVLDNSELSMLTGSELMANGSPSSCINGMMSPLCRSRKYDNTHLLKQVVGKSPGKLSAQYSRAENQGRRLFSSAKTPQREQKEPAVTQNTSSARNFQKCIPRVPAGSAQRKVPNSASTSLMPRIPKKPLSSLPMTLRSTTSVTTVSKSNKKLSPVKNEHFHRLSGHLPKSKIASGRSMKVPPAVAAMHKETSGGSVKLKDPQISPSSFGGSTSTVTKPSALRMPSPSVGFFNQENAQMSHGNTAERNVGKSSSRSTPLVKPPRYKLPEDLKAGLHLSKVLSTNGTGASNLPLPVTTDSNTNTPVMSEKHSLSKVISTDSAKSRDANYHERPEVYCSLARNGDTTQPLSSEKNDGARNSVPMVCKGISPFENSLSIKATCFSTIDATCSSTKPSVGSKLSPSCISSQRNDLSCQSKTGSGSIGATDLGKRALPVTLSEDQMPPSDRNSVLNHSLHDEGEYVLSEEPNTEDGIKAVVIEDPLSHMGYEHKSWPSCISPQRNDLSCQSKTGSGSIGATDLEKCYVGKRALPVSLGEAKSCTLDTDSFQNSDPSDHFNTECATSIASMEYTLCADHLPPSGSSSDAKPALVDMNSVSNNHPYDEGEYAVSDEPNTDGGTELETNEASAVTEDPLLHVGCERNRSFKRCSPVKPEAPMTCVERQNGSPVEQDMEDKMEFDNNKSPAEEGASHTEKSKAVDRPRANTILRDHLKNLVPFTEEWLAVMEACGQEVLEQKSGAVQNSPPDKTVPEPSPWSPVKRKAQDVGPFDCTKYSKSVRTSGTP